MAPAFSALKSSWSMISKMPLKVTNWRETPSPLMRPEVHRKWIVWISPYQRGPKALTPKEQSRMSIASTPEIVISSNLRKHGWHQSFKIVIIAALRLQKKLGKLPNLHAISAYVHWSHLDVSQFQGSVFETFGLIKFAVLRQAELTHLDKLHPCNSHVVVLVFTLSL